MAHADEERPSREAVDGVAAALATVGNWMFSPATRRRIMASSGLGLSLGDYTLLAQISVHAPVRLSVLAELMEVDKSTLSPPAKRLEQRGFIERRPDPADARAQLVSVTRAGKLAIGKLWKARAAAVAELLADWDTADVEQLATSLGALSDAIKNTR
ncbi:MULTISPECIES: MarR family winged helix-turn-helix transcriptional regulator [Amycolatopsis]|uniref:MarR family winged helix-turn-helix transcriptional regulator n=1 Tax=Amycolatopsis TaxID=1813 RepID=UPI000B8B0A0C|nr:MULTISPECIES: MarR family transcriptional regulator [Amycolatopsis]OXM74913.1 MarR family transcriptional regulator [Amycolatopsis sp. KNN50.9b]